MEYICSGILSRVHIVKSPPHCDMANGKIAQGVPFMKKILVIVLSLSLLLSFSACSGTEDKETTPDTTAPETETTAESETETETVAETETETEAATDDPSVKSEGVMTYAEYAAAELDTQVVIEAYVQAKQSWWEDKATVYTQDADGPPTSCIYPLKRGSFVISFASRKTDSLLREVTNRP